jgi:hypothetical protein
LFQIGALSLGDSKHDRASVSVASSATATATHLSGEVTGMEFFSILSCVLDGSVSCGALLPILESLVLPHAPKDFLLAE